MLLISLFLQSCNSPVFITGPNKQVPIEEKRPKNSPSSFVGEAYEEKEDLANLEDSMALEPVPSDLSKGLLSQEVEVKEGPIEAELTLSQKEASQVFQREQRFKREVSRIASQPIKTSRTQLSSPKAIQESTKRKPALLKNQQPFSENQQISKDRFKTRPTREELGVGEATKGVKPLSPIRKGIIPVTSSILETDNKAYTTKGGHEVRFQAADREESLLQQYHGLAQELKLPGVDEKTPVEEAKAILLGFFKLHDKNF